MRVALLAAVAALVALLTACGPDEPKDDLSRFVAPASTQPDIEPRH